MFEDLYIPDEVYFPEPPDEIIEREVVTLPKEWDVSCLFWWRLPIIKSGIERSFRITNIS